MFPDRETNGKDYYTQDYYSMKVNCFPLSVHAEQCTAAYYLANKYSCLLTDIRHICKTKLCVTTEKCLFAHKPRTNVLFMGSD